MEGRHRPRRRPGPAAAPDPPSVGERGKRPAPARQAAAAHGHDSRVSQGEGGTVGELVAHAVRRFVLDALVDPHDDIGEGTDPEEVLDRLVQVEQGGPGHRRHGGHPGLAVGGQGDGRHGPQAEHAVPPGDLQEPLRAARLVQIAAPMGHGVQDEV